LAFGFGKLVEVFDVEELLADEAAFHRELVTFLH
jgi:hypothetical protein